MKPLAYLIGFVLAFTIVAVPSILLNGYVLATLWQWFIVAMFNAPALTIAQAIGISTVCSLLTYQYHPLAPEETNVKKKLAYFALHLYGRPLFTLAFGWVVTWFL